MAIAPGLAAGLNQVTATSSPLVVFARWQSLLSLEQAMPSRDTCAGLNSER